MSEDRIRGLSHRRILSCHLMMRYFQMIVQLQQEGQLGSQVCAKQHPDNEMSVAYQKACLHIFQYVGEAGLKMPHAKVPGLSDSD